MPGFMKTLMIVLALMLPPNGRTDDCLARLWERLRQIDVRVAGGQYDEQQRQFHTRQALLAYLECRGYPAQRTSPNPFAD